MSARYHTGRIASPGDRLTRHGEQGTIVSIGEQLSEYGVDAKDHPEFAMIRWDQLGLVCEPLNREDIELLEKAE